MEIYRSVSNIWKSSADAALGMNENTSNNNPAYSPRACLEPKELYQSGGFRRIAQSCIHQLFVQLGANISTSKKMVKSVSRMLIWWYWLHVSRCRTFPSIIILEQIESVYIYIYMYTYIYMEISNNPQKGGNIFEHSIFYLLQDDSTLHMLLSMV